MRFTNRHLGFFYTNQDDISAYKHVQRVKSSIKNFLKICCISFMYIILTILLISVLGNLALRFII